MLSAKARQHDKDIGLKVGADDYLVKPADGSEIVARIKTLLTGTGGKSSNT
jgi:DNA-binding response OmpR family regulator